MHRNSICGRFICVAWIGLLVALPQLTWSATSLGDRAASMQAGSWVELATNNIASALIDPRNDGGVGHILPYAEGMQWDPVTGTAFFVGSDDPIDYPRFVSYSAATNSWSLMPRPSWFGSGVMHEYDQLAINPEARFLYYIRPDADRGFKYNLDTGVWSGLPTFPGMAYSCCGAAVYFPEMQGLIVVHGNTLLKLSDATNQWSILATGVGINTSYHSFAEYNPVHKVVVFGGGNDTSRNFYKLDSTGRVSTLRTPPINLENPRIEFTYDPVTGAYLVFEYTKKFYTYDVSTDTWTLQGSTGVPIWAGQSSNLLSSVAVPIPDHGVIMFARCESGASNCNVYLYKHAQRSTTMPLAPTDLQVR